MAQNEDDAYDLTAVGAAEIPTEWQNGAVYTLEQAVRCPHCREPIRTLRVVRMLRTQVTFTSPLPRAGRALVCPLCERIVSAELSGIL
jgi:hypothetical protein